MGRLLFVDSVCPKPYDPNTLLTEPMGGTEATVIRVAEAIASKGHTVVVSQHCRKEVAQFKAKYDTFDNANPEDFDAIVVLRDANLLLDIRSKVKNRIVYLWMHDMVTTSFRDKFDELSKEGIKAICVSQFHRHQLIEAQRSVGKGFQSTVLYNPIDDNLVPDFKVATDNNKLVFFSSPHKGLQQTLELFKKLREFDPKFTLTIANPGYLEGPDTSGYENVTNIGAVPHHRIIEELRSALCTWHVNYVFPETFGLVYAESNAIGVPFLTSRIIYGAGGQCSHAVDEIWDHNAELITPKNAQDPINEINKEFIDRTLAWKKGYRPRVRGNEFFRLKKVTKDWLTMLSKDVYDKLNKVF